MSLLLSRAVHGRGWRRIVVIDTSKGRLMVSSELIWSVDGDETPGTMATDLRCNRDKREDNYYDIFITKRAKLLTVLAFDHCRG